MRREQADEGRFYQPIAFWQYVIAGVAAVVLVVLARCEVWPFGTEPRDLGNDPSIFEVLINDRLMIGFLRAAIVAVAAYIVISVPALVVARRWMKGLTTTGVTADEAREADDQIEELEEELQRSQEELEAAQTRYEINEQLLLEAQTELESALDQLESGTHPGDNAPDEEER